MTVRPIIHAPDPRLKVRSRPVEAVTDEHRQLMDDMLDSMYAADGIGLAAIQIGVDLRILVIDLEPKGDQRQPQFFVNPEVTWASDERTVYNEGCLSVPELYDDVERPAEVKVRYLDYQGAPKEVHATGLLATCLQHEMDHLEGVLFIDHLSRLKRSMILRKLEKAKRHQSVA